MKHPLFSSTLFLSGALLCLLPAFGTKPYNDKPAASAAIGAQAGVSLPAPAALTCTLPAPASFDGEKTGETAASLAWTSVSGAVSYRLTVHDTDTQELISSTVEYGVSKNLIGLEPGATYRCVLASMCSGSSTSDFVIVVDILL